MSATIYLSKASWYRLDSTEAQQLVTDLLSTLNRLALLGIHTNWEATTFASRATHDVPTSPTEAHVVEIMLQFREVIVMLK